MIAVQRDFSERFARYSFAVAASILLYVLSSGPVLAASFWLREATHCDGFYAVSSIYYPLLALGRNNLFAGFMVEPYIGWWVHLFGTVGPG